MLTKYTPNNREQVEMNTLDQLVPKNHLVRKVEADHLRHTEKNKIIYARRKESIERVFADAKEKHGMR